MAALNEAYGVLSSAELRARFDAGDDPNDPMSQQGFLLSAQYGLYPPTRHLNNLRNSFLQISTVAGTTEPNTQLPKGPMGISNVQGGNATTNFISPVSVDKSQFDSNFKNLCHEKGREYSEATVPRSMNLFPLEPNYLTLILISMKFLQWS
jgi:curved DNA-binding protein CbpA